MDEWAVEVWNGTWKKKRESVVTRSTRRPSIRSQRQTGDMLQDIFRDKFVLPSLVKSIPLSHLPLYVRIVSLSPTVTPEAGLANQTAGASQIRGTKFTHDQGVPNMPPNL